MREARDEAHLFGALSNEPEHVALDVARLSLRLPIHQFSQLRLSRSTEPLLEPFDILRFELCAGLLLRRWRVVLEVEWQRKQQQDESIS